jgi:integrase
MKKAWPKIRKVTNHGKTAYLADARIAGQGERKFFPTKAEAGGWASLQRIRRQNEGEQSFDDSELSRYGWTVKQAIEFTLEHLRRKENSITIAEAITALVAQKAASGRGDHYQRDLTARLGRLSESLPGKVIATITTADLENFIAELPLAPGTKNTFRRDINTLWSFAEKRGWAIASTARKVESVTVDEGAPGILTTAEVSALLAHTKDAETLVFHAIGLFAGLRVAEIKKLDWSNIDFESKLIEVTARTSKTRTRRLVPLLPNLESWIKPHAKTSGKVLSREIRRHHRAARAASGVTWSDNCMRHSFVSYRLAATGNAAQTALEAGHDQAILFAHYRELVRPADAKRFFAIAPINDAKIVEMHPAKVA